MQKINSNNLKRDSLFAIFIPVTFVGLFQVAFHTFSWWGLFAAGIVGGLCFFQFVYKFVSSIEDLSWQQQLNCILQKVSKPVIIADLDYKITFANHSLNRLPIATLLEKVDNVIDLLAVQDNKLNSTVKESLDGLKGKLKCQIEWKAKNYICTIIPLFSPTGKRWGMLLEFQDTANEANNANPAIKTFDTLAQAHGQPAILAYDVQFQSRTPSQVDYQSNAIANALKYASHPLLILDEKFNITQASNNFVQLIHPDQSQELNAIAGCNIFELLNGAAPSVCTTFEKALETNKTVTFVAEHFNQICDWVVTPVETDNRIEGYIVEISYPSKQELRALEENIERMEQSKTALETELRHFTQGLANCKLYQKSGELAVDGINADDYHHPLIKNSSKIMCQLYTDLHHLHGELDTVKASLESSSNIPAEPSFAITLKQVNALSNALSKNVYEAEQDLTALHQELTKLKGLLAEQKGLNQVYMKPLSRAMSATEQALLKTVNHSETVTLILQQIHENQTFITQLQEFIAKLSNLPCNGEPGQTSEIYQEIIGLLDRVKNTLAVGKLKLKELLLNFDGLNNCWKQAQENLQACLHSGISIDQASKRCSAMSNTSHDYSQLMQDKIAQIIDLTQAIQDKTTTTDIVIESNVYSPTVHRHFNKVIIEVDEIKKKAEDVLLEGLSKF